MSHAKPLCGIGYLGFRPPGAIRSQVEGLLNRVVMTTVAVCIVACTRKALNCFSAVQGLDFRCPRQDSNLRTRLRRPLLYPLSYGGVSGALCGGDG